LVEHDADDQDADEARLPGHLIDLMQPDAEPVFVHAVDPAGERAADSAAGRPSIPRPPVQKEFSDRRPARAVPPRCWAHNGICHCRKMMKLSEHRSPGDIAEPSDSSQ
jgi:hypothetical protein